MKNLIRNSAAAFAVMLLCGCLNIQESDSFDAAIVKVSSDERTILPLVEQKDLKEIRISVKEEDELIYKEFYENYEEFKNSEIRLTPGVYEFTVTAISGGCLFTSGKVTKEVQRGLNSLNLPLYQSSFFSINGKGTVDVTAVLDEEPSDRCYVQFEFLFLPMLNPCGNYFADVTGKKAHLVTQIESGSYIIRATLFTSEGEKIKGRAEAVRVADKLTSSGIISFSDQL